MDNRGAAAGVARAVHELADAATAHEPREALDALHRLAGAAVDARVHGESRRTGGFAWFRLRVPSVAPNRCPPRPPPRARHAPARHAPALPPGTHAQSGPTNNNHTAVAQARASLAASRHSLQQAHEQLAAAAAAASAAAAETASAAAGGRLVLPPAPEGHAPTVAPAHAS
jgi:hypothetical protein